VLDLAVDMTRRLGGSLLDFVDVLYASSSDDYYGASGQVYRKSEDLRGLFTANTDIVVAAAGRLTAQARADLLHDLRAWNIAKGEAFTTLLVAQAGDGSKAVREAALAALTASPKEQVETLAVELLATGNGAQRAAMVDLLTRLGLPGARAALEAHREKEKTARIATAIDTALTFLGQSASVDAADDAGGYTAIDGRRILIPTLRPLTDGPVPSFGDADTRSLKALIAEANERIEKQNEELKARGQKYSLPSIDEKHAGEVIRQLNGEKLRSEGRLYQFLTYGGGARWMNEALGRLPDARALLLVLGFESNRSVSPFVHGPGAARMNAYLHRPDADLRALEPLALAAGAIVNHGSWRDRRSRPAQKGDFLRVAIQDDGWRHQQERFMGLPREALWPYLAENQTVFDEALGLAATTGVALDRVAAIRALTLLPATPARYYAPLLEVGTGESKAARQEARALLADAPGVEDRLIAMLDDSRQGVRAGVAQWLSARGAKAAIPALRKRLKSEKSEVARAALLTALGRLGEDISKELDPESLLAEAQKGLKSVKGDKLAWLGFADLVPMRLRNGSRLPAEVLRWWAQLAFKLKQPGGNALFQIYLDQLVPADAEALSTWILESWIAYDTAHPSEEAANAHARANAPGHYQAYKRYRADYTEEQAFAQLKAGVLSQFLNSGAESKGVLALALRAPPTLAADRVRAYLKTHGSRTSQAAALLELLAGIGDAVTLQVVIAASIRLKQKGVQKLAGELVTRVAEARDWTLDELADRTVPTAGFDEDGVLALPCGEDSRPYEARLLSDLSVKLRNPAGDDVAALPSGQDETTKDSKKQLSAAKKALKQVITMQSGRLYEALCAARSWATEDWRRAFHDHPVMRRLIERLVWVGVDAQGRAFTFRPSAEGDFTDAGDNPVDLGVLKEIRLAHGALFDDQVAGAWEQHLTDYEVKPLFAQFGRTLLRVSASDAEKTAIEDRKGWVTEAFTIRGVATKLGYERGPAEDGGFFTQYRKPFHSAGLVAVVSFTGNSLPEQNVPAALISLSFEKAGGRSHYYGASNVKLTDVPVVLLSECWNDYHAMAAKAAYDPEWAKRSPW
jgi:HEAT repeat protein